MENFSDRCYIIARAPFLTGAVVPVGKEELFFTRRKVFPSPPALPILFKKSGVFGAEMGGPSV